METKKPLTIKVLIAGYAVFCLLLLIACTYATYVGWVAENGALTEYQQGFIQGMGANPSYFTFADSGAFVGMLAPSFTLGLICILSILKRWNFVFLIAFILDLVLFTSSVGFIFKLVVVGILASRPSREYFKPKKDEGIDVQGAPNN